jgi:hypothetical protein
MEKKSFEPGYGKESIVAEDAKTLSEKGKGAE